jgi:hypothetical protein
METRLPALITIIQLAAQHGAPSRLMDTEKTRQKSRRACFAAQGTIRIRQPAMCAQSAHRITTAPTRLLRSHAQVASIVHGALLRTAAPALTGSTVVATTCALMDSI